MTNMTINVGKEVGSKDSYYIAFFMETGEIFSVVLSEEKMKWLKRLISYEIKEDREVSVSRTFECPRCLEVYNEENMSWKEAVSRTKGLTQEKIDRILAKYDEPKGEEND